MKNWKHFAGILALFAFFFTNCPTPDGGNNNQSTGGNNNQPTGGNNNQTPTVADFNISGTGTFTYDGNSKTVTVTAKEGKTSGIITVKYNGTTDAPSAVDTYTATFDVAAAVGWNAVSDLPAGTLTINEEISGNQTPTAADYNIGNLTQTFGSVTAVTITPKIGKSSGVVTVKYNNSTTVPSASGTYTVTFDVAAADGWNSASGLSAGTLTITKVITFTIDAIPAQIYTGSAITPIVTVKDGSTMLTLNTHYTVSYSNNVNVGTATVTISGMGNYAGSTGSATFIIDDPITPYIIIGSGTSFTATRNGVTIGTANQPIQTVIDAIRTHAGGNARTVQFGNGTAVLNIGTASISFNNTGGTWGTVTLTGKITSSNTTTTAGTIVIVNAVSVTSTADIANTGNSDSRAIYHNSTGTLTISGGTISTTTGSAVYNTSTGKITISGTAKVTSANTTSTSGTVYLANSGTATAVRLEITGGTVENTDGKYKGIAVYNASTGGVTVSGGTVSATSGIAAVYNASTGGITVSGGTVSATSGMAAVHNASTGGITVSGGTVSVTNGYAVENESTGTVTISGGTVSATTNVAVHNASTGKITVSETAKVTSTNTSSSSGTIYLSNSGASTAVRLEITGGIVENTAGGTAVYNPSPGTVTISGGTVSATSGYAVFNTSTGKVTVSGTAKITSANTSNDSGTVCLAYSGTATAVRLEITGGTIENTGNNGNAVFNGSTGGVTISGGTVTKSGTGGYAVFNTNANAMLTLSGNPGPTITGVIRPSAAGQLTTASGFTPGTKTYALEYASYTAGNIAVVGGSNFLSNFVLYNQTVGYLASSGNNLIIIANVFTIDAIPAQIYTGNTITPTVTVKDGSTTLTLNTHYTVSYSNNTNAGTATVTITGMGSYTGIKGNATFIINPKIISFTIDEIPAQTYTGNEIMPTVTVKDGSTTLTLNTHYTVSYSNNTNAGTATVTITGTGNYMGSTGSRTFTINNATPAIADYNISNLSQKYGSVTAVTVTPKSGKSSGTVTVKYNNSTIVPTDAGTYTVTFDVAAATNWNSANGLSAGTLTITKVITFTIDAIPVQVYTGNAITPIVTVKDGSTMLTLNTHYTVSYSNNTNAGTATVTISGMGNYAGSTGSATFIIDDSIPPYIITGSGTSFTATRNGVTIGTANQPIQTVINAIRTHAAREDNTIQFGDGTTVLNIGTDYVSFNNTGGTWGTVTLTGKITSNNTTSAAGTIVICDTVSVTSTADIANTAIDGYAVYNTSTGWIIVTGGTVLSSGIAVCNIGLFEISGGTIQATGTGTSSYAIWNYNTWSDPTKNMVYISGGIVSAPSGTAAVFNASSGGVYISGGTVSSITGTAVYNRSNGNITVSGTAKITSANITSTNGTIYLASNGTDYTRRLLITDGTVENTAVDGNAVYNASYSQIMIIGGKVQATGTGGYAIFSYFGAVSTLEPPAVIIGKRYPPNN